MVEQRCTWRTFSYHHPLKHGYWLMRTHDWIRMNGENRHTSKIGRGTMLHLKDNSMLSPFEIWLLKDVITQPDWMNARETPTIKNEYGTICFEAKCTLHRMSTGDKNNIINEAETFLLTIWLDELGRIYWEEYWAHNDGPITTSYKMHVWMTRCFHEGCTYLVMKQFLRESRR